ncbi:hypothetical protein TERTU_3231 [Teredinibacter turnerae T7901]|uniref:Uncharacterized protein n=1 Tax=Teredinibacter turnerae (strain ATCC 39867 / T7901) TaxID=377629 RepID=C5BPX2_TERTT|nr:hypothetical protein TERTU_3231 [Teredinibacter turnerae T7901]
MDVRVLVSTAPDIKRPWHQLATVYLLRCSRLLCCNCIFLLWSFTYVFHRCPGLDQFIAKS